MWRYDLNILSGNQVVGRILELYALIAWLARVRLWPVLLVFGRIRADLAGAEAVESRGTPL